MPEGETQTMEARTSDRTEREACLFVLPWGLDAVGGVNTVVESLMRQARLMGGYEPLLLVSSWDDIQVREAETEGQITAYLRMRSPHMSQAPFKAWFVFLATLPAVASRLLGYLRRHNVTVVNIHYPGPHLLAFTVLRRLGLYSGRIVISVHGSDIVAAGKARGLRRLAWRWVLGSADRIVACSNHLSDLVGRSFPTLADRTRVVWNGVDIGEMEDGGNSGVVPPELADSEYVLAVGSFERHKGHDLLVQAFHILQQVRPELRLVIIGRPGPTLDELRSYSAAHGLAERVHLVESVPRHEIGAYYRGARVCVVPSRRETFGITALEAGVFQKPVVATRVGGIPEVMEDGVSGVLVTPENPEALARGIKKVLDDPSFAATIGEGLHRAVVDRFSWPRAWSEYLALMAE